MLYTGIPTVNTLHRQGSKFYFWGRFSGGVVSGI